MTTRGRLHLGAIRRSARLFARVLVIAAIAGWLFRHRVPKYARRTTMAGR
jgi:hypothetical protein